MMKRPKPGEDEDDILKMQEEYLREKSQNENYKPSASVVNLRPSEPAKRSITNEDGSRKPSKYAQAKGIKSNAEKRPRTEASIDGNVIGDILEKNIKDPNQSSSKELEIEDDKVYFPKINSSVLGSIVEKNLEAHVDFNLDFMPSKGFPEVLKRDSSLKPTEKSIHRQHLEKHKLNKPSKMDVDAGPSKPEHSVRNLPPKSYILSSKEANDIHNDNIKLLSDMTEQEILEEQRKLLSSVDPQIVQFIKSRRQKDEQTKAKISVNIPERMDTSQNAQESMSQELPTYSRQTDTLWDNDVLSNPDVNNWLHFDSLEKDKLEWMKGIEECKKENLNKPYEARFNFSGYLLPYSMEYTEKTKSLFHHGEDPHRPGYTIMELIELTRSTVTQQRVMALNTLAGILEYYSAGTYKDILELPLSKIFFIIRIALDENKVIILEPALRAMRNLIYNRIDEACLDALIGFEEGTIQPCLENDKSEIQELESAESELKDFHLAEIDLISAVLRTDILQRIYYILEAVKPSFNCVQYCLQILTRIARDSLDSALKIVQCEHLMKIIISHFLPITTVNFVFDPQIVYHGKPLLSAIKLLRVLSLQSLEIAKTLVENYEILKPISEYINSSVDRSYGLRIQIEAYCCLSNLLCFGIGVETTLSLFPVVITTLYKHVQASDVLVNSSVISATHAAVVLQLINRLLLCNLTGIDNFKTQFYPLLKVGVNKWTKQLSQSESYTCAHLRLLCAALDCSKTILLIENIPIQFLNDSLKHLSSSRGFKEIIDNLIPSSNLLSGLENKDLHSVKNLLNLGGSVIDASQKVLPILNVVSPMPFLATLFRLLTYVNDKIITEAFLQHLWPYLRKLSKKPPCLADNWFTRMETNFVHNILKLSTQAVANESDKDLLYAVANKLCYIFRIDKKYELEFLFENIVFNKEWITAERLFNLVNLYESDGFWKTLTSIAQIRTCYNRVVNLNYEDTGPNIMFLQWKQPILPRDWIYLPILGLYSKSQEAESAPKVYGEHAKKVEMQIAAEKDFIISCSLEWILFNELCFPDLLNDIELTDRFCRIMCVFLCDSSLFLNNQIKNLLGSCVKILFKNKEQLNFDKQLVGLNNFQDFYTQFLEQFQSVSYGDHNFAACVLVPLAQRHNVKWRKLIWSEYAGCLRALDCPEELLCYNLEEYFFPAETDESLLKSYFRAISSNLLRPDTIAFKIAQHHVNCHKKRSAESVLDSVE